MFDDQNGMFFEYDGQQLHCVRRNSTSQLGGTISAASKSNAIVGLNTKFTKQLSVNDKVVIRGMSYKVTAVDSDTSIHITPSYRGTTRSKIIMTKTEDLRIPQTQWNIDKCDGSGVTGLKFNINKMQMAYMDYSWYGAGKVRFDSKIKMVLLPTCMILCIIIKKTKPTYAQVTYLLVMKLKMEIILLTLLHSTIGVLL